jgi:hypothetical protein
VRPRELGADADEAGLEVDVGRGESEQLGEAHPSVERGRQQRPVAREAGAQGLCDLCLAEDALRARSGPRPLGLLQPSQRIVEDGS